MGSVPSRTGCSATGVGNKGDHVGVSANTHEPTLARASHLSFLEPEYLIVCIFKNQLN